MLEELLNDDRNGTAADRSIERMWPLDFALSLLGILVFYTIATRLDSQDPRLLYNPLTYAFAVPAGVVGISILLRFVANRFIRRSMQLGFLVSVLVHLLLLIWAVNKMILTPLLANPSSGAQVAHTPVRKTVPDYLFSQTTQQLEKQPDWARPIEAETASRDLSKEPRQRPLLDEAPTKLGYAQEQPELQTPDANVQIEKSTPELSQPTTANTRLPLAKRERSLRPQDTQSIAIPDVPQVDQPAPQSSQAKELTIDRPQTTTSQNLRESAVQPPSTSDPTNLLAEQVIEPSATNMSRSVLTENGLPRIASTPMPITASRPQARSVSGAVGTSIEVPTPRTNPTAAAPSQQVAERNISSLAPSRASNDTPTPLASPSENMALDMPQSLLDAGTSGAPSISPQVSRNARLAMSGEPEIRSSAAGAPSSPRRARRSAASGPVTGVISVPAGEVASNAVPNPSPDSGIGQSSAAAQAIDRLAQAFADGGAAGEGGSSSNQKDGEVEGDSKRSEGQGRTVSRLTTPMGAGPAGPPSLNNATALAVPLGPPGFTTSPGRNAGASIATALPDIRRVDLGIPAPPKRFLGGAPSPAGSQANGASPFDRRMMRTSGGAAPAPSGQIGPETEQAIELGLAYLAQRQNADGSWSLQGHGEEVLIQSDTAATGLCLLAFQGAGYTHKAHQYAGTVQQGLRFLIATQKPNGDLYRPEDAASNRNAWLYSHAIATLALCEAYGMTSDPELRSPAQRALQFIATSQDPRQGGWRYQPQSSSDTSVTGWMMMALKSGELSGLDVSRRAYSGIQNWMDLSQASPEVSWEYSYNPLAPDTPTQRHGRKPSTTMTAVGLLARLYLGWERSKPEMQRGADVLMKELPAIGNPRNNLRDTYYWYYATQVMFHMGGDYWKAWNSELNPILTTSQIKSGPDTGSWDPMLPLPDRWAPHAGRIYVTTMNLLSLEVHYRHLPIYVETGK